MGSERSTVGPQLSRTGVLTTREGTRVTRRKKATGQRKHSRGEPGQAKDPGATRNWKRQEEASQPLCSKGCPADTLIPDFPPPEP